MADNVEANAGSGGAVFAADEIGGVVIPRVKLVHGADGVNDGDVASGNPLPVVQTGTPALPTGAATAANQATLIGHVDGVEALLAAIQTAVENLDNAVSGSELQVDVLTMPVNARTTDSMAAALQTDAIMSGLTALTPKFAIIDAASSGDNTLVAAVASRKLRVLALVLVAAGTVNVRFESGAGGTALSGQLNLVANTGFSLGFNPVGWFETASNTLLNLELSAAISVDGMLVYVEVP